MPYIVSNADGSITISVADSTVDTSTYSLALVGRNISNYGAYFVQNSIRHLENFASATAPTPGTTLTGQLWYDKAESLLRVYDGTNWKRATNIVVGTQPTTNLVAGTAWFNTVLDKLYVYDGTSFKTTGYSGEVSSAYSATTNIGSPTNYGTKLRNIFLKDSSGVDRAVLALVYVNDSSDGAVNQGTTTTVNGKETIMGIVSDHATFTVSNAANNTEGESINWYTELVAAGSIGATIRPGLNLRTEYNTTALALSERSYRADAAYTLNTGSVGTDGSNIAGNTVWYDGKLTYSPTSDNTATLGSNSFKFASAYVGTIYIGNGTSGSILTNGTVSIGANANAAVNHVYANNITVNDVINFNTADLATSGSPVLNAFAANITVSTALNTPSITKTGTDGVGDIGQSGNKFATVYATTFSGTATTATNANSMLVSGTYRSAATTATNNTVAARDGSGDIYATVFRGVATSAQYADLAEKYLADADYEVGTVIVVGGEKEVTASSGFGQRAIGVVSANPAYMMNSELEGGTYIALKGRVPVKVTGVINKGDRLIASNNGCATAGVMHTNDVFAVALESKADAGDGVVEAVIL